MLGWRGHEQGPQSLKNSPCENCHPYNRPHFLGKPAGALMGCAIGWHKIPKLSKARGGLVSGSHLKLGCQEPRNPPCAHQAVLLGRQELWGQNKNKKCSGESMETLKLQQTRASSSLKAPGIDLPQKKRLWASCWEHS